MRIENNNNVGFGAYFKENQNFKKLFVKTPKTLDQYQDCYIKKFTNECPNHEVEILDISKREGTIPAYYAELRNRTIGSHLRITLPSDLAEGLLPILRKLTISTTGEAEKFWTKGEDPVGDLYTKLTTPKQ